MPSLLSYSTLNIDNELDEMPFVRVQYIGAAQHIIGISEWPSLPDANDHPMFFVAVYALIGLGTAIVTFLSATMQYTGALRASRKLFKQLLVGVVRATFRWHDVTPHGRMLNRFSKVRLTTGLRTIAKLRILKRMLRRSMVNWQARFRRSTAP